MGSLVAIGDSIVNGFTKPVAGVPALGCGQWLALSLDYSYTRYAQGGWSSSQIAEYLIPKLQNHYDVAVVSVGTNDAVKRIPLDAFSTNASRVISAAASHADIVAVLSIPMSRAYSMCLADVAARAGAVMVDAKLSGPRYLSSDLVHPTALGTQVLAERIASALNFDSRPSDIIKPRRLSALYYIQYVASGLKPITKRIVKWILEKFGLRRRSH